MKLKIWELGLLMAVVISLLCGFTFNREQQDLSEKMIRLHVVANSDSDYDQSVKLKVRDSVLEKVEELLGGVTEKDQAEDIITGNIGYITESARDTLKAEGVDMQVRVSLRQENFPTREYDTFTLPAGEYTSLRVEIGEAQGRNWWCVVFPALCQGSYGTDDAQSASNLTDDEVALITEEDGYVVKFKLMEFFTKLSSLFDK